MERKIGEIFEYNGEWYQAVSNKDIMCSGCSFVNEYNECDTNRSVVGSCGCDLGQKLIFKKLKKLGKPYTCNYYGDHRIIMMQDYRYYCKPAVFLSDIPAFDVGDSHYAIAIKQNKQDMENKELNLKPFDIAEAKNGKQVVTRDGRPARIVCYDAKGTHPIVALVEDPDFDCDESPLSYTAEGFFHNPGAPCDCDLVMPLVKRKGWVNIYKKDPANNISDRTGAYIFPTKEEATEGIEYYENYVTTTEIEWEE